MTTRAARSLYKKERSGPNKAKQVLHPRRSVSKVDTALPGVSATDRRVGSGFQNSRNRSKKAISSNRIRARSGARPKTGR